MTCLLTLLLLLQDDPVKLVERLGDSSPEVREKAVEALKALGERADAALKAGEGDANQDRAQWCRQLRARLVLKRAPRIAVLTAGKEHLDLSMMDADGEQSIIVRRGIKWAHASPDGGRVLCGLPDDSVVVLDLKVGKESALAIHEWPDAQWSRDGARLAFDASRYPNVEFAACDADGSHYRVVHREKQRDLRSWGWSSDGKQLIIATSDQSILEISRITAVDPTSGKGRALFEGKRATAMAISPVAGVAAVSVRSDEKSEIWEVPLDGAEPLKLATLAVNELWPTLCWTPDGKRLVCSDGRRLVMVDRASRKTAGLTTGEGREGEPVVSPDGTWVAYVRNVDGDVQIRAVRSDGTGDRLLSRAGDRDDDTFYWPDVRFSPDGQYLLVAAQAENDRDPRDVWLVTVATSESRKLLRASRIESMWWTPR